VTHFTAVFDACVLYPAPLRDLLMHLALTDLFRAKWTDQIHDEWIRSVLEQRPDLRREQLERTRLSVSALRPSDKRIPVIFPQRGFRPPPAVACPGHQPKP
jgi:hypothetical protein